MIVDWFVSADLFIVFGVMALWGMGGFILGWLIGRQRLHRQITDAERKQTQERKQRDTQENVLNRFANVVEKSELARHYRVERFRNPVNPGDFVRYVRVKDEAGVAAVEVNFFRPPDYHVMIRASTGDGWSFGSDEKSLREAVDHLRQGLCNLAT